MGAKPIDIMAQPTGVEPVTFAFGVAQIKIKVF